MPRIDCPPYTGIITEGHGVQGFTPTLSLRRGGEDGALRSSAIRRPRPCPRLSAGPCRRP
jgi:hypothetical protein